MFGRSLTQSDVIVAVVLLISTIWLLDIRVPRLSVWVRRFRTPLSLLLLNGWIIVRLLPGGVSPDESLLELSIHYLLRTRKVVLSSLAASNSKILSSLVPILRSSLKLLEDLLAVLWWSAMIRVVYCLYHYSYSEWMDWIVSRVFEMAKYYIPGVQFELDKQTQNFTSGQSDSILNKYPDRKLTLELPTKGRPHNEILKELEEYATKENQKWKDGKVSGTVYPSGNDKEHTDLLCQAYKLYTWGNPLHPGFWPKLNQCEAEVIAMTSNLLHNTSQVGCLSSGGTESIILAIRAHLYYYAKRRNIVHPELICGSTAHAAVNKACEMFGIRQVVVDCNKEETNFRLLPVQVERRITSNTIMIYASAPTYPQGTIDPIAQLSEIAYRYDIGLHVDACLGGFVLPFCKDAPVFDFRNRGVTSMSADTHKYGYASKGTSVVLYRTKELRHGQYFTYPHWTGTYSSFLVIFHLSELPLNPFRESFRRGNVRHTYHCRITSRSTVCLRLGIHGIDWLRWL